MYLIIIVGHTGQGKTTFAKKMIEGKRSYVFDINNEHPLHKSDKIKNPGNLIRHISGDADFFTLYASKLRGFNVVFEDSTGYLRGKQSAPFIRQIVMKRHTKNNFILLFHSVNRIPPELLELSNVLVIFKTNDNEKDVMKKFDNTRLVNAIIKVRTMPKYQPVIVKMI